MGKYDYEDTDTLTEDKAEEAPEVDESTAPRQVSRKAIRRGWGNAEETRQKDSPFADRLKISKNVQVIKFLEAEPYTSFHFHWIERQGQKSFTCIDKLDPTGCPRCQAGDRPQARFAFNVALLDSAGEPIIKSLEAGVRVMDQLKNFHTNQTTGPIDKNYWAVTRSGDGTSSQTNFNMVRERDLAEDYRMAAIDEDEMKELMGKLYDESIVPIPQRKTLADVAAEDLS